MSILKQRLNLSQINSNLRDFEIDLYNTQLLFNSERKVIIY